MCPEINTLSSLGSVINLNFTGTATDDADYTREQSQTKVNPLQQQICVPIGILDDTPYEDDSVTVTVTVSSYDPHMNIDPVADTFTLHINDEDRATTVTTQGGTGREGGTNPDHTPVTGQEYVNVPFTFTLARTAERSVSLNYVLESLTARQSLDYTGTGGTITIPEGQTAGHVLVLIVNDSEYESDRNERITLVIIGGSNRSGATGIRATGYIQDNDPAPTIRIADATVMEGEILEFQLTLSEPPSFATNVAYSITDDTAAERRDYWVPRNRSLSIPSGETTAQISIEAREDLYTEGDETLTLTNVVNADIQRGVATGTIEDEDEGKPTMVDTLPGNRRSQETIIPGDSWENRTAKVVVIEHQWYQGWWRPPCRAARATS